MRTGRRRRRRGSSSGTARRRRASASRSRAGRAGRRAGSSSSRPRSPAARPYGSTSGSPTSGPGGTPKPRGSGVPPRAWSPTRSSPSAPRISYTRARRPASPPSCPASTRRRPWANLHRPQQLALLRRNAGRPDARAKLLYGVALQRLGRPRSAERMFAEAARLAPQDAEAQTAAAVGRFRKEAPERAFSRLGPLSRRFPHAATVRFHLGLGLLWLGNLPEAKRQLLLARRAAPGSSHRDGSESLPAASRGRTNTVLKARTRGLKDGSFGPWLRLDAREKLTNLRSVDDEANRVYGERAETGGQDGRGARCGGGGRYGFIGDRRGEEPARVGTGSRFDQGRRRRSRAGRARAGYGAAGRGLRSARGGQRRRRERRRRGGERVRALIAARGVDGRTAALPQGHRQGRAADRASGDRAGQADRARRRPRQATDGRGEPAPRRLDRKEVPQPGPALPGSDPGGNDRARPRGGEVRSPQGLQVLDLRDVVDPPGRRPGARRQGADDPHARPRGREAEQDRAHRAQAPRRAGPRARLRGRSRASSISPSTRSTRSGAARRFPSRSRSRSATTRSRSSATS